MAPGNQVNNNNRKRAEGHRLGSRNKLWLRTQGHHLVASNNPHISKVIIGWLGPNFENEVEEYEWMTIIMPLLYLKMELWPSIIKSQGWSARNRHHFFHEVTEYLLSLGGRLQRQGRWGSGLQVTQLLAGETDRYLKYVTYTKERSSLVVHFYIPFLDVTVGLGDTLERMGEKSKWMKE